MITITPAGSKADCVAIQTVFNHPQIIAYLGGFVMLEGLVGKLKSTGLSLWKAEVDGTVVGGMEIGGRSQCHYIKFGEVGVLPEHRRKRVGTALYVACICQAILEGRRLCEDTIVGDNPFQFVALPKLGIMQVGTLPMKTASFKDIALFSFHMTQDSIKHVLSRLPEDCQIEVREDAYCRDLWGKNNEIYAKKKPEFLDEIARCRELVRNDSRIKISVFEGSSRPDKACSSRTSQFTFET